MLVYPKQSAAYWKLYHHENWAWRWLGLKAFCQTNLFPRCYQSTLWMLIMYYKSGKWNNRFMLRSFQSYIRHQPVFNELSQLFLMWLPRNRWNNNRYSKVLIIQHMIDNKIGTKRVFYPMNSNDGDGFKECIAFFIFGRY